MFISPILLNTPQLTNFVDRAERFKVLDQAALNFNHCNVTINLLSQNETVKRTILKVRCDCGPLEGRFSALAHARSSFLSPISSLECLNLTQHKFWSIYLKDGVDNADWLQLLRPFTAVKHLLLSGELVLSSARALNELSWGVVVEVCPALQSIFLEGFQPSEDVVEAIGPFIVRWQLSGHPVTVHSWEGKRLGIDI